MLIIPLIPVFLWSSAFVVIRYLQMDFMLLTTSRLTVSAMVFLILLIIKKQFRLTTPSHFKNENNMKTVFLGVMLFFSALTGFLFYNGLINYSLQYLPAGVLASLVNTLPLISIFFSYVFFKEKITFVVVLGSLIAFIGVIGIAGLVNSQGEEGSFPSSYMAMLTALAAAFSLSGYFVLQKKLMKQLTPLQASGFSLIIAAVLSNVLLPFLKPSDYKDFLTSLFNNSEWLLGILYLGCGGGFAGFLLWNITLKKFPMGKISNILFLVPLLSLLGETVFLSREFRFQELGFMLVIMGGVFLSTQKIIGQHSVSINTKNS